MCKAAQIVSPAPVTVLTAVLFRKVPLGLRWVTVLWRIECEGIPSTFTTRVNKDRYSEHGWAVQTYSRKCPVWWDDSVQRQTRSEKQSTVGTTGNLLRERAGEKQRVKICHWPAALSIASCSGKPIQMFHISAICVLSAIHCYKIVVFC